MKFYHFNIIKSIENAFWGFWVSVVHYNKGFGRLILLIIIITTGQVHAYHSGIIFSIQNPAADGLNPPHQLDRRRPLPFCLLHIPIFSGILFCGQEKPA